MRSLTEIARCRPSCAVRPTSGRGDCRKARARVAAPSTSWRSGTRAAMSRPAVMPAMAGWRPDSRVATQSAMATSTYAPLRHTRHRPSSHRTTRQAAAAASAAGRMDEE